MKLDCVKTETGDDVKNVEVNFGMLKTLIEVRAEPMQEEARAPRACFDSPHIRLFAGQLQHGQRMSVHVVTRCKGEIYQALCPMRFMLAMTAMLSQLSYYACSLWSGPGRT